MKKCVEISASPEVIDAILLAIEPLLVNCLRTVKRVDETKVVRGSLALNGFILRADRGFMECLRY